MSGLLQLETLVKKTELEEPFPPQPPLGPPNEMELYEEMKVDERGYDHSLVRMVKRRRWQTPWEDPKVKSKGTPRKDERAIGWTEQEEKGPAQHARRRIRSRRCSTEETWACT